VTYMQSILPGARHPLMEWSGRAPAPPASDAGMGRVSTGGHRAVSLASRLFQSQDRRSPARSGIQSVSVLESRAARRQNLRAGESLQNPEMNRPSEEFARCWPGIHSSTRRRSTPKSTASSDHRNSTDSPEEASKYPPAKPGALMSEPLKAAWRGR
jgi:hypothetical protein